MRVLLIVCLLGSALAQPPATTHAPRSFFQRLGDVIKDTASTFAGAFTGYIQDQGSNVLHNVLPDALGQLIGGGFWDLIHTVFNHTRRDATTDLLDLQQKFQQVIAEAEHSSESLAQAIENLVDNLVNEHISPDRYLNILPGITSSAREILHRMVQGLQNEMNDFVGNKRLALDLSIFTNILHAIETQGQALLGQVQQQLAALVNPQNLLSLAGQLVGR